jgi:hypothetical protein
VELAIIGGIAIVAIVALMRGGTSESTPAPMAQGSGGNVSGTTGPAVQLLQEQPSSTAGQAGSGSMAPSGSLPPVATGLHILPPNPVRVPINTYPVPRPFRTPIPAAPRPTTMFGRS